MQCMQVLSSAHSSFEGVAIEQCISFLDCRPIAGSVNFCPAALSGNIDNDFLLDVVKHEILHALVSITSHRMVCNNKIYFYRVFQ